MSESGPTQPLKWLIRQVRALTYQAVTDDDGEYVDPWPVWEGTWDGRIADGTRFGRPEWRYQQTTWTFAGVAPKRAQVVAYYPDMKYVAVAGTSRKHVERKLAETVAQMRTELAGV